MKLQLDIVEIKDICFGDKTCISNGVLHINLQELQGILQEDKRLKHVDIELAHPGESIRIVQVSDVIEPRAKKDGQIDFPGVLGRYGMVGQGNTCVLRGAAVVISEGYTVDSPGVPPHGNVIDMAGPGADLSVYGKTHNVILIPHPADGVGLHEYRIAMKLAGLKTAVYLAKAGIELIPDDIEIYDLPISKVSKGFEDLPKIVYIFQFLSRQFESIPGYPILYGCSAEQIAPTLLHPNEIFDGALLTPYRSMDIEMFSIQNHPIIKELYIRHGRDLSFCGVIITIAHDNSKENERAAIMAANLAKWYIGADGAILTKCGGGVPEVALALTARRCEELGVKTAIGLAHYPTVPEGADSTVLFNIPEIDAIVSFGSPHAPIVLPPVKRVIGKKKDGTSVDGEIHTTLGMIKGVLSQIGNSRFVAVPY